MYCFSVVLVACPGADAHTTWTRSHLPHYIFDRMATRPQEFKRIGEPLIRSAGIPTTFAKGETPAWPRSGLRREEPKARVLTYTHSGLAAQTGLKNLADDLLHVLSRERAATLSRPIFFICHSIGGLVVKLALTEACRNSNYRPILEHCYGVTFFGQEDIIPIIHHRTQLTLYSYATSRFQLPLQETVRSQYPETSPP